MQALAQLSILSLSPSSVVGSSAAGRRRLSSQAASTAGSSSSISTSGFPCKQAESCRCVFFSTQRVRPSSSASSSKKNLKKNLIRAVTGESASTSTIQEKSTASVGIQRDDDMVKHITTVQEFEEALISAKQKLVVVEYAASHSVNSRRIYPSMVDLSKTIKGVVFLLVLGDESDATKELCERAGVENVPHFVFYKNSEKIHEEKGITSDVLEGDVLYYGDNDAPIYHVHNKDDFEVLLKDHASDHKLVVLDVGLKSCGPCVKIYPTFVKLSKRMAGNTVFARMHGDENEECVNLLKSMDVVEVPTFLFIRDGKPLGRYVGSGKGELVGEILRYNGVRVT